MDKIDVFLNIFELSRFPIGTFVIVLFFHFILLCNLGLKFDKKKNGALFTKIKKLVHFHNSILEFSAQIEI